MEPSPNSSTPSDFVRALGIASDVDVAKLEARTLAFESVQMATQDVPLGALFDLLAADPSLRPPRTGHLGNWGEITRGRAGALDFNKAVCARGLGDPLVYCFNQTEAEGSDAGDGVYLPGSLVERGERELLPLFTWDGAAYVRRTRDRALFCPFVQTEIQGERIPLVELHWRRMQALSGKTGFRFRLEGSVLAAHADELEAMVTVLLDDASRRPNPRQAFQDVISHSVAKDGTAVRTDMRRDGDGYWLDDCHYASAEAVARHAVLLYSSVTEPRRFFDELPGLPAKMPMIASSVLGRLLCAIFTTHYPDVGDARPRLTRPFNVHLHWGARDMAGFPPRQKGYFSWRSRTRSLRVLSETLAKHFDGFDPICFVLIPAAVFMLCPTTAHPRDVELMGDLFRRVALVRRRVTDRAQRQPRELMADIERVTASFMDDSGGSLSSYFVERFAPRAGVLQTGELPDSTEPVEPEGFRALTWQEACMIVGAIAGSLETTRARLTT